MDFNMRNSLENIQIFKERRQKLAAKIPGAVLICASPEEQVRNGSVHFSFRQDSNLYYLTGFEEPETIFVFRPGLKPESILFVRKKDASRETWDGFRYGPEAAQKIFAMDAVYPIEEFDSKISDLLQPAEQLYYRMYKNSKIDKHIQSALIATKTARGRSGVGLLPILDADQLLGEMRVIKTQAELNNHRQACQLTSEAHVEVMRLCRPGINERELHGYFVYQIMKKGAAREGYNTIVATGANACTLHYVFNDQVCRDGELILVDAGGEFNYFTADITRTYPVSGKWTKAQVEVYQGVLNIQKDLIEMVKPGLPFQDLHQVAAERLTDLMLELGLMTGTRKNLMESGAHRKYYPHGVGHFLGMDVHDAGLYQDVKSREPRKIEEGMVFTIEPGLYIPADDISAASEYRGIGIRIEDNILVTSNGYENLTKACPKEIEDLSKVIGQS